MADANQSDAEFLREMAKEIHLPVASASSRASGRMNEIADYLESVDRRVGALLEMVESWRTSAK